VATLLKERSTYWVRTNSSSRRSDFDYRAYWKIYYEQSEANKKLLRTKIIVDYYLQTYWDGSSLSIYDTTNSNVYINGSSIGTISINTSSYDDGSRLIKKGSKSTYVYHNKDGTGSFTFRGTGFDLETSTTTYTLPKINVGTEITNNSSDSNYINLDSDVTFTLNDLTGQVEANKLYYKIKNDETEYVISESTTETTIKYSFPVDIITNFPNNENISLTVYCKNLVSNVETTTTVYLKLPDSYVPSASLAIADVMENKPSALSGLWIKNQSKLKGTITATGVKGSSIKSYLSSISDFSQQYNTNPFTTQLLTIAGSRIVSALVTDSRGRQKTVTQTINVIDYSKPTFISLNVKRCLQDGTLSENGTYVKVICKYSISPIDDLNTKTLKIYLNGSWEDVNTLSSYSGEFSKVVYDSIKQDQTYTIKAVLTDLFGDVPQEFLLGVAYKTVSKRAGGKGITFGAVATEDNLHSYMDAYFHKVGRFYGNVQVDGSLRCGGEFSTDPTNSFQTALFGDNKAGYRFKAIRSGITTNDKFPRYGSGIAFATGDTHGVLFTKYDTAKAWIGAGNSDKLVWMEELAFKKSLIYVTQTENISFQADTISKIPLDTQTVKVGNKFSFDATNNRVIIGENVNLIEIIANCKFQVNTANKNVFLRIKKNGETISNLAGSTGNATYLQESIAVTMPLEVNPGDYIELYCSGEGSAISSYEGNALYIKEL